MALRAAYPGPGAAGVSVRDHPDMPNDFLGQIGRVLQCNDTETALEFGQQLRVEDSPQFVDLILTGDLTVQGLTTMIDSTTLLVEDKNIELGVVDIPTDVTADGGGITLLGTTPKTIQWLDATDAWTFNQDVEIQGVLKITGGAPGAGKVLTSDALGLANWTLPTGGGWTDDGTVVRLTTASDKVGIGTAAPNAQLDVRGGGGVSVGGFPSGVLHVTSTGAGEFNNSVITGHNLFGGNKQLWYLGSTSSSNDNIAFINRQNAKLQLFTNSLARFTIGADGLVGIGVTDPDAQLEVAGQVKITGGSPAAGRVLTSDAVGLASWVAPATAIRVQLSDSTDQEPTDTNPTVITFNTQDDLVGMTHSTTVNAGEITVDTAGVYSMSPQPQVGKTSGGTAQTCDVFVQVNTGSGFVNKVNSNIKLTVKDSEITDVIIHTFTIALAVGDKIRFMQRVSSSVVGMGLKATAAEVGPPTVPATPSVILSIHRVGD